MKKIQQNFQTKQRWLDYSKTKNKPKSCGKHHSFCNLDYEWGDDSYKIKQLNCPINSAIPNIPLPDQAEGPIQINYDSITEENLDDWIAQSMNRNLNSLLNPQKKYYIPSSLDDALKERYRKKKLIQQAIDETYFQNNKTRIKSKSYVVGQKRKKLELTQLYYDYKQLHPRPEIPGTAIRIRQNKKHIKQQIKRRNAVLLSQDAHYQRLQRQISKQKIKKSPREKKQQKPPIQQFKQECIYSYNIQSISRKSCYDVVPNSIIEVQLKTLKQPNISFINSNKIFLYKQADADEKFRHITNIKTKNAISKIDQLINESNQKDKEFPTTNINYMIRRFKKQQSISKNEIKTLEVKDKPKLQLKVMKLLNNMQLSSEKIDINMAKFNVHMNQIFLKNTDSRPQIKWILKAQQKIQQNQQILAIDCYKQAIILQPQFFIPVYNIAVLLEKCNMLESSKMWFNLANQFQADSENVSFGLSLVNLKQLQFQQSLKIINELITRLQNSKKNVQLLYYYIRALCYKQLNMFQEAKHDYQFVQRQCQPSNYNILGYFMFSMVFGKLRRAPMKFQGLSYMKFRETIFLVLYQKPKTIKEEKEDLKDISQKIIKLNFFKRFSISLIKKMLSIAKYQRKQKGDLIFQNINQTVMIINGIVSMRSHQKNFKRPDTVGVLMQGGIIGTAQINNTTTQKTNIWYIAQSEVQIIKLSRSDFNSFWKGQITFEFDFKYNFIRNIRLFKGLPQSTLFKLCQILQKNIYPKGTILFNDCSYRITFLNKPGHGFGIGKNYDDPRFYNVKKVINEQTKEIYRRRARSKICKIIRKNIFKFNNLKFNRLKYPGLFIVSSGMIEIENDQGFRCNSLISQRQYFGQSLIIQTEGLQNYGRLVVQSQTAQLYLMDIDRLLWAFTEQDKQIMMKNNKKRQIVDTIRFLTARFKDLAHTKISLRQKMEDF